MKALASTILMALACCAHASEPTAREYAQKGMQYADLFPGLTNICDLESPIRNMAIRTVNSEQKRKEKKSGKGRSEPIPPTQVFDNLYYIGTGGVSSWAITTSDGIILVDALNNNAQAKQYIEAGLIELGLDPNSIKYLLITHGHGDHYGGQEYLVEHYQPRLAMTDVEWTRLEQPVQDFASPRWGKKPSRDITVADGESISLGETTVSIYLTPGHTPGTMSLIFPVYDNGEQHIVSLWGGTGLNYGPDEERILAYSQAAQRFKQIAKAAGVDIYLSNHPTRDGSSEKMLRDLPNRQANQPHPFVMGQAAIHAYDMLGDCTYAQVLRIRAEQQ
ncbi:MBL fold metallo-hydrolase [Vibrio scophthalmi]|uniref:MBL fold metallo-hydrolase n=1 Tax=Vibrio scophthalmi TaxID=45658 RepID=UPI002FF03148